MHRSKFVHLHVHSHYSLLDGACQIPHLLGAAKKHGMGALALTDHGNLFGVIEFYKSAMDAGIKPIVGYEAYVAPGSRFSKESQGIKEAAFHLTLLVRNEQGYKNLIKLATTAYLDGFYYKPRIDKDVLREHGAGLVGLSGCLKSEISCLLSRDAYDEAKAVASFYRDVFGKDHFFLEMQDNGIPEQKPVLEGTVRIGKELGIPLVATNDIHYLAPDDAEAHEALLCINTGKTLSDSQRLQFGSKEFYFKSPEEMAIIFRDHPEALSNTLKVAEMCNLEMSFKERHVPRFDPGKGMTTEKLLRTLCEEGIARAYPGEMPKEVRERLDTELKIIQDMGYTSYFLIVWDFVKFAHDNHIPSWLRGSGASSLVAYALRLTDIDPMKHDLLFRRFLDPERREPPDIDIDLCEIGRERVINYVKDKYGKESTAQIITFGTMMARAAVRDVGRALGMPLPEVDAVAKKIPATLGITLDEALQSTAELRQACEENPQVRKLFDISKRLEGLARHASTHAAGMVIADRALTEYLPLYKASDSDIIMTQFAMEDLEAIGMLKMDMLGLRTLTAMDKACDLIERRTGKRPDFAEIGLEDPATYELLGRGETKGVFQFGSSGIRDLLVRLKPNNIEDVIAVVALYRPGPLQSNMDKSFVERKHGRDKARFPHPKMEPILAPTYGVIVYQEQIMRILNELGNISMGDAYELMKAISKKKADVIADKQTAFIAGCKANGIAQTVAEEIFGQIEFFGGYGFNKSHATSYAYMAYQTVWLKAHYPTEFMAALLTCEMAHSDKVVTYIEEARRMGIEIVAPSVNESAAEFAVAGEKKIGFGLGAIKNVGEKAIEGMIEARSNVKAFETIFHFCEHVDLRAVNRQTIEAFIKAGAMDCFGAKRSQMLAVLDKAMQGGGQAQSDRKRGQKTFFDSFEAQHAFRQDAQSLPEMEELPENQLLAYEREAIGFYVSRHPLARYEDDIRRFSTAAVDGLKNLKDGQDVVVGGIILTVKPTTTKAGDPMARFTFEDLTGMCQAVIFREYASYKELVQPDRIVYLRGRVDLRMEEPCVTVSEVIPIEEANEKLTGSVTIKLRSPGIEEKTLTDLLTIVKAHPGPCPVFMEIHTAKNQIVSIRTGQRYGVKPSATFATEVEALLGEGHIKFKPGNGNGNEGNRGNGGRSRFAGKGRFGRGNGFRRP